MIEQIATVKETYAFGFIKEKQKKVTEESGTISMALAKNIASRKVPQLFTSVEEVTDIQIKKKLQALQAVDEAKLVDRGGLLTKQGKKGRGIAYKWNIKDFGPVSIPIAEAMIAETERQIRIGASIKYYNKKARTLANLAEND